MVAIPIQPLTQPETVSIDRWLQPLSTPVLQPRTLAAHLQQAHTEPVSLARESVSEDRWHQPLSTPVRLPAALTIAAQTTHTEPVSLRAETVTEDRWHQPLTTPVWPACGLSAHLQSAYTAPVALAPEAVTESRWHQALATPVWPPRALHASLQATHTEPVSLAREAVSVDRWLQALSVPVWSVARFASQQTALIWGLAAPAPAATVPGIDRWGQPLSTQSAPPRGLHASLQLPFTMTVQARPETVTVDRWLVGLSIPVQPRLGLAAASQLPFVWGNFTPQPPPPPSPVSAWAPPFATPMWPARGLAAHLQTFLAIDSRALARGESVSEDRWHQPFSTPVWSRVGLAPYLQLAFAVDQTGRAEAIETGAWVQPLALPVWPRRGLAHYLQIAFAVDPFALTRPETVELAAWLQPFSVPVRARTTLTPPAYALSTYAATSVIPLTWFQPLAVPPVALRLPLAALQQAHTALLPAASVTWGEAVSLDRWLQPLSTPVLQPRALHASIQLGTTPSSGFSIGALPGRIFLLSPDVRALFAAADVRTLLLPPDIRTVILPPDEASMTQPILQWSPAAGADVDVYFLSLSRWLPAGDIVTSPSVTVGAISGDATPLTVGAVAMDTGTRAVVIPPGVPYSDPGPRIQAVLSGGTRGKTYITQVSWHDTQGRTITRPVHLKIEW